MILTSPPERWPEPAETPQQISDLPYENKENKNEKELEVKSYFEEVTKLVKLLR